MKIAAQKIIGRVIDSMTGQGLQNISIEVWDESAPEATPLTRATTGPGGRFIILLDAGPGASEAAIVFKIFSDSRLIQTTPLTNFIPGNKKSTFVIPVNLSSPGTPGETWLVKGRITNANGQPLTAMVSAYNVKLTGKHFLGQAQTEKGAYAISYQPDPLLPGCNIPDLVVEANLNETVIAASPIIYNAGKITTIDLVAGNKLYKGPSEYQVLENTIRPCLGDMEPAGLNAASVEYLANKTGVDQQWLSEYVLAHRYANATDAAPPLFYACFRTNLPLGLDKLIALRPQVIRSQIKKAVEENIIDEEWENETGEFISRLKNAAIKNALSIDSDSKKNSLGKLFALIDIPAASQAPLLELYTEHQDDTGAFWQALEAHKTLGEYANPLRLVLKVSALTQHFEPATKAIMEHPLLGRDANISNLARLDGAGWRQITKAIGVAPDNIPGEGEEQLNNYALLMERTMISAFPTQHVADNILQSKQYQDTELPKFFEVATDFSFEGTNINSYVNKLNGQILDKAALIRDLSKLQRLFNLAPTHNRYPVMEVLDKAGIGSAMQVRQFGKNAFLNVFGDKLGSKSLASDLFNKAAFINATAMNLAVQYNDVTSTVLPYVLQGVKGQSTKPAELDLPDLNSLFGAQSFCSCEHCSSVYSAAAYFVDLLSFLKEHYQVDTAVTTPSSMAYVEKSPGIFVNGLDLLFNRRSDLGNILLNCENTNTAIPYLDIVLEVLENAVLNVPEAYQTTSTSEELKANPEHIKTAVYDDYLAHEIFPFTQPFNLWNEEGRVCMEHMGVARYEMMDGFQFRGNANEPDDQSKYTVQLNLTSVGKDIVTGKTIIDSVNYSTHDFWGMGATGWIKELSMVRTFIEKAGISYVELLQFLQMDFVNATGIVRVKFAPDAPCDIDQAQLAYWDETAQEFTGDEIHEKFFIRAHCFFRLLQKTPWSIFELGRVMDSLGVQNITDTFIAQLSVLLQLQSWYKIEPLELASWWADLNTRSDQNNPDERSFYASRFLNKTVFNPQDINADSFVFTLNEDLTELKHTGNRISDYLNEIEAALNIGAPDLLLLTGTLLTPDGEIDDDLSLKNLSQLFRIVSLTRATGISVKEYLIAIEFIAADPFNAAAVNELLLFIEQINQVKRSGSGFSELQYLLLDQYNSADGIAPTEDRIIGLFTAMQQGLIKIQSEHAVPLDQNNKPIDPAGEITRQKLSLLIQDDGIKAVVTIVEAATALTPDQEADAASYLSFLDVPTLITDFASAAYSSAESRFSYILQGLVGYLVTSQSQGFIIQTLSTDLSISLDTAELLLTGLVYSPGSDPLNPAFAITDFTDPVFAYDLLEEGEPFDLGKFSAQHNTYLALYKSSLFIHQFSLNAEEVSWTFTKGPGIGWLDLNAIAGAPVAVFSSWLKMEKFFYQRSQFAEGDTSFFDLMDYAADPALIEALETGYEESVDDFIAESTSWTEADRNFLIFLSLLSEITGWETYSLFFLASDEAYSLGLEDFKDEQAYYQLMKCFEILGRIGASAMDAWDWMSVDLTAENSGNIKQTTKAKYSETEWLKIAAPLRDILRERQRDAITSYMIQNRGFEDADALYAYYLLDVETSACTMSSRIVLANSSIQLFVQRHLMNLEVETLDLDADRWAWMKNYRTWEANRKVFLYPENWIEPDLRLVKSEFFGDLQNALLQNDVTPVTVESAISEYLEKLDEVSNIEVCGTYHQFEEGDGGDMPAIDVLHVFGKTTGVPAEYYYRTYIDNSYWTTWTRVNLDIQGEHLIPVILNNRLYLFWPEFIAANKSVVEILGRDLVTGVTGDPDFEATMTYYDINLAYSEFKEGSWLPKKLSKDSFHSNQTLVAANIMNGYTEEDPMPSICFHSAKKQDWLEIKCIQKTIIQPSGSILWGIQGIFKFLYDRKEVTIDTPTATEALMEPPGTEIQFNSFREISSSKLELITADVDADNNYLGNDDYVEVLNATPGSFRLPMPHQYNEFVSQDNFFYGDDYRNFFVKPYNSPGHYIENSATTYSTDSTTGFLDHYLNDKDIAIGVFHETAYDTRGVEAVIFDVGPRDQLDPLPSPGQLMPTPVSASEWSHGNNGSMLPRLSRQEILDENFMAGQVNQLHYLGARMYRFNNFYHPYINEFIETLNVNGLEKLLTREMQQQLLDYFPATYLPTSSVSTDYPRKEVDFTAQGAMSFYNQELFFHVPMLIAGRLSKNQQFEDAQKWYHFIFNPLDRSSEASPNKFWQYKPFFELYGAGEGAAEDSIYNLMYALSYSGTDVETLNKKAEAELQVAAWLASPYDPHAIAALRPVAYMKAIVMKYIDNLLAWGDFNFQQDTIESINEATQLYILAAQILGKRPELIPVEEAEARSYNDLVAEGTLDVFSNALVTLENVYSSSGSIIASPTEAELLPKSLYFCIPNNPNLLAYWDFVDDRLFKIRHCMNIEGTVRQLPLFQPPIDPGLLVKARAAGLSIGSVLNDLYAPLPHYRYRVMVQRALEFCAGVKELGNALLNALEKKDIEQMTVLRAGHELRLLQVMTDTKKLQLDEAKENLAALEKMRKITEARHEYYVSIEKINAKEQLYMDKLEDSRKEQKKGEKDELRAAKMHKIPDVSGSITFGAPPKVSVGTSFGGSYLGSIASAGAAAHRNKSAQFTYQANKASVIAGYMRRWDDWKLQEKSAAAELTYIDKQILAAKIRVALMEKEISNHSVQTQNSTEMSEFITNKFTSSEFYDWVSGQLSAVYFQSYQMAYDLAKRAQRSLQYELGTDQAFIAFGYWDNLRKGLLAGDRLYYDIRRMEMAFLDQTKRCYELTKSVSLATLDPMALVQLRETGTCYVNLPEVLFDMDNAGHYMRRIRSIQLTLPCVAGPYTSVSCKLTLLENKWRKDSSGDDYPESIDAFDSRFVYNTGGTLSIATSSGQNDSGMFQLNYSDERYLPFEGAGAISNWRLELPTELRSFDYNTLSDVIIQVNYQAKDGGDLLKARANEALLESLMTMPLGSENAGLTRMFSLRHEFSNEWYRFLHPPIEQAGQQVSLLLDSSRFPYQFRKSAITVIMAEIMIILEDAGAAETIPISISAPGLSTTLVNLDASAAIGGQLYGATGAIAAGTGEFLFSIDEASIPAALGISDGTHLRLNTELIKNMMVILSYTIQE